MDEQEVKNLLGKYNAGRCTIDEKAVLETWYLRHNQELPHGLSSQHIEQATDRIWARLEKRTTKGRVIPLIRYAAAASIILAIGFGSYFLLHKNSISQHEYANDIPPGTGKPILTLANGRKIILGKSTGTIAKQGGISIQQNKAGQVSYSGNIQETDAPFNTLTNPRGGNVISLILPDGSVAKLDAASSITYQTAFTGKSRKVFTTGKVYFAVNYNKDQPFFVSTNGQTTQDLGTHFIVEAYDDEPAIKTTLIEGSVLVSKNGKKALLKPGQQTIAATSLNIQQADLEEEVAWINGDFDFNKQNLHSIMRELSRVYNIKITYKEGVENLALDGMISRAHNISAVLEMIKATEKVHFEINGREVTVIAGTK